MSRIVVAGAAGFVGRALLERLRADGTDVVGWVRPGSENADSAFRAVDLRDLAAVRAAVRADQPSALVNAAVRSAYAPGEDATPAVLDDVLGTAHLLDATRPFGGCRFVQLGSFLEYGPSDEPLAEGRAASPISLRGATKAAATALALAEAARCRRPVVVLRLFTVYGPGERPHRLVPAAIRAGVEGTILPLTEPGLRRDLIFVEDVGDAVQKALVDARADGLAVNIASGTEVSNEEVVDAVEAALGVRIRRQAGGLPRRPIDTPHTRADIRLAAERLDWRPRHSLAEGIAKTVAWFRGRLGR